MATTVRTYDPNNCSFVVGVALIHFDELTIERAEDTWTFSTGTSGEVTRTKNANTFGTITFKVPQASSDNDLLTAMYLTGSTLPAMVKDNYGTTVAAMDAGTIIKPANIEMGKESSQREWKIGGAIPIFIVGSNN